MTKEREIFADVGTYSQVFDDGTFECGFEEYLDQDETRELYEHLREIYGETTVVIPNRLMEKLDNANLKGFGVAPNGALCAVVEEGSFPDGFGFQAVADFLNSILKQHRQVAR